MKLNSILLVEDEKNISDVIKAYLEKEGYDIITAFDGDNALKLFTIHKPNMVILDLMLPKLSGEEVCREIRKISDVPIIMLTAKSDEDSKIEGLNIGADDYVLKPFSPRELVSRVKALMRRTYSFTNKDEDRLAFSNNLTIYPKKFLAKKNDIEIDLTSNEFKVLLVLAQSPKIVFSREQLMDIAFGYDYEGFERTIDTYIKNIRHKIEDNPKIPEYIQTVYGVGYKFEG